MRVTEQPDDCHERVDKKGAARAAVNRPRLDTLAPSTVDVVSSRVEDAEVDALWSYVGQQQEQRWLWHAIEHWSG